MSPGGPKPIGILHLSDLHFKPGDSAAGLLGPLREDLKKLPATGVAFIVVSGDFVDRGDVKAFPAAIEFLRGLQRETNVPWDHFILCPGNHDIQEVDGLFTFKDKLDAGDDVAEKFKEDAYRVRVAAKYPERFAALRTAFQELTGHLPAGHLSRTHFYPTHGLQFVALNTAYRIDKYRRKDAALDPGVFSTILAEADEQVKEFAGPLLRIAVWHHAVQGMWAMAEPDAWVQRLSDNKFALLLHGDVHEPRAQITDPFRKSLYVAGGGTIHAADPDRPPNTGYFYNFLEIARNFSSIRVHVREQDRKEGPFDGYFKFEQNGRRESYFAISDPRVLNAGVAPTQEAQPPVVAESYTSKLPATDSTLIGRDRELATLEAAWTSNANFIQIIAPGGTGKTALMTKWYKRRIGQVPIFGWSFYRQGTSENSKVSSDDFFQTAIDSFQLQSKAETAAAKAMALVLHLRRTRALLILDGLEPLQDHSTGELRDYALKDLLRELAVQNAGLVLCTTRVGLSDITEDEAAVAVELDNLSETDGARYLREKFQVHGSDDELCEASRAYGNHALALTLLGTYLKRFGGDISRRFEIDDLPAGDNKPGHRAKRVMQSYARIFQDKPEGGILRALGFFDRPAERAALKLVLPGPLDEQALTTLREARLILSDNALAPVDCHPLVREHFGALAKATDPDAFRAGHSRLFDYYCELPTKQQPDTLEEMTPLFHAVGHGCHANRHNDVLNPVYRDRINHGPFMFYLTKNLGASGTNLALVAAFFEHPWSRPASKLTVYDRSWVLNEAAFSLRALGRLADAVQPAREAAEMRIMVKDWSNAARSYANLSELLLCLGQVPEAIAAARKSVDCADRGDDAFMRIVNRTTLADALRQAASPAGPPWQRKALVEAGDLFADAERRQAELEPGEPILYSLRGYQYCDFMLSSPGSGPDTSAEVLRRARQTLATALSRNWLLMMGLDHLSLGRAHLSGSSESLHHLGQSVATLRRAGQLEYLPLALLARGTDQDLAEVHRIAFRSGMKLHLTDFHLAIARRRNSIEQLEHAEKLIQETGYHRRDPEAAALRRQLCPPTPPRG